MNTTLYVILGPTAVGKTELSLNLAAQVGSPCIISADSRQMYRDLPVCTAAPTPSQMARVPHRFVGTLGLEDRYSAAQFERDVLTLIPQLIDLDSPEPQGIVMSGGSMMYIDAIIKGIDDMPDADPQIRDTLKQRLAAEGLDPLVSQLQQLDPLYCSKADLHNTQRVVHALEMCLTTGKPFSSFHTGEAKPRPFNISLIGLMRDRAELDVRIEQRVDQMFADGLVAETQRVYTRYQETVECQFRDVIRNPGPTQAQPIPNLTPVSLNTVGLKEMLLHFAGIYTLEQARERIIHNTRVYSKKQLTWFKRNEAIRWVHPNDFNDILLSKHSNLTNFKYI